MNDNADVVCVGVIVADCLANGVDKGVFDRDITRVPLIKLSTGGDALNQAINLSSMNHKVRLCGKVGTDGVGTYILAEASNNNIDTKYITFDQNLPTSISIVLIQENGERNFIGNAKGTNSSLLAKDINVSAFKGAKIVSLGSLYGSLSLVGSEVKDILAEAKLSGCITVSDMMHADRHSFDDAKQCFPFIDYFIPNLEEASHLTKKTDLNEIADTLLNSGIKNVIIKLGKDGCYFKNSSESFSFPSFQVTPVDTTGAGDAFVSGFISGLLDNKPVIDCIKLATAAGNIAVQQVGATGAIKHKDQLIDVISKYSN